MQVRPAVKRAPLRLFTAQLLLSAVAKRYSLPFDPIVAAFWCAGCAALSPDVSCKWSNLSHLPLEVQDLAVQQPQQPQWQAPVDPLMQQRLANMNGKAFIKVVGVGGGGGNAINRMISTGLQVRLLGEDC